MSQPDAVDGAPMEPIVAPDARAVDSAADRCKKRPREENVVANDQQDRSGEERPTKRAKITDVSSNNAAVLRMRLSLSDRYGQRLFRKLGTLETKVLGEIGCSVCYRVCDAPIIQCCNGHLTCGHCRERLQSARCPVCRIPMAISGKKMVQALGLQALAANLVVPCHFSDLGCPTKVKYADKVLHQRTCAFQTIKCSNVHGTDCQWAGALKQYVDHLVTCVSPRNLVDLRSMPADEDGTFNLLVTKFTPDMTGDEDSSDDEDASDADVALDSARRNQNELENADGARNYTVYLVRYQGITFVIVVQQPYASTMDVYCAAMSTVDQVSGLAYTMAVHEFQPKNMRPAATESKQPQGSIATEGKVGTTTTDATGSGSGSALSTVVPALASTSSSSAPAPGTAVAPLSSSAATPAPAPAPATGLGRQSPAIVCSLNSKSVVCLTSRPPIAIGDVRGGFAPGRLPHLRVGNQVLRAMWRNNLLGQAVVTLKVKLFPWA